jgi:hypothetical protein
MPNSVFGRFRRHPNDTHQGSGLTSPPPTSAVFGLNNTTSLPSFVTEEADDGDDGAVSPTNTTAPHGLFPELDRDRDNERDGRKSLHQHKRDSSILSLSNSVQGLRRSVSLRSSKSHSSTSPYGHRSRQSSHLSTNTSIPPEEASSYPQGQSRKKPSISTFPFAKQAKSAENLPLFSPTFDDAPPVPSLSRLDLHAKSSFSMLAGGPPTLRRHATDRPSVSSQGMGSGNGAPLQPAPTLQSVSMSGQNPSAVYQSILETTQKRMATIEYLKTVHEGDVYYLSTLHYPPGAVSAMPSMHPHKLGRRSTSYFLLGYSLPALLELNSGSPMEYLKALIALLQEFETYQNLSGTDSASNSLGRGRMGQMFKAGMGMGLGKSSSKGRRSSTATDSFSSDIQGNGGFPGFPSSGGPGSPHEITSPINAAGHDFQNLLTPSLPFDPDFGTTFATLCDTLIETYSNLLNLITTPEQCSPTVGEAFAKADKSVRKILVANVMREFEETTRNGIKGEVAGLGKLVLGGLM